MTTDHLSPSPGVRIKRVKAHVYKSPDPMPPWCTTMLIGKPHRKVRDRWVWEVNRNHHFLTTEERAQYARGELLLIQVPAFMDEWDADKIGELMVPEALR